MRIGVAVACCVLIVTAAIAGAAAQGRFSTFSGTVVDETNGFLPDATAGADQHREPGAARSPQPTAPAISSSSGLPSGRLHRGGDAARIRPTLSRADPSSAAICSRVIQLQLGSLHGDDHDRPAAPGTPPPAPPDPDRAQKIAARRQNAEERQKRATEYRAGAAEAAALGGNILQPTQARRREARCILSI